MSEEFDYVIVGGGTAGCVLAGELHRRQAGSIALIESGFQPMGRRIHTPALYSSLFGSHWDYHFKTIPQPSLRDRKIRWPRGKMLGGCSGINAMIYSRGSPFDFLEWPAEWQFKEVLPFFQSNEHRLFGEPGPASISQTQLKPHPLSERFLLAAQQAGMSVLADLGVEARPGVCFYQRTQQAGRRLTTYSVFLKQSPPHLITNATVEKILIEDQKATGVRFVTGNQAFELKARRGVVLTAGTIHSPVLLQRSGIGLVETLERSGVEAKLPLEGVGANLQDHLVFPMIYAACGLNSMVSFEDRNARFQYASDRTGPLSSNIAEAGGFSMLGKTNPAKSQERPQIQWHFTPTHYLEYSACRDPRNAWTIGVTLLHPKSRGRIQIASDENNPLIIDPGYLSNAEDLDQTIAAITQANAIAEQPALAQCHSGQLLPGAKRNSPERIESSIRAYATTIYHPVGTCAIGSDNQSVVDSQLRVHGLENLYIADASVIPKLPSANPQAIVMMIGCRMASILSP